jgi:hypothetical protein
MINQADAILKAYPPRAYGDLIAADPMPGDCFLFYRYQPVLLSKGVESIRKL